MNLHYVLARLAGWTRPRRTARAGSPTQAAQPGITVVIPSRNGRDLLAAQLPGLMHELEPFTAEVIVADNGSEDGTEEWLKREWPQVRAYVSREPLSFARAVNAGIARARYSRVCLLNNDMLLDPGFFAALAQAFEQIPDLFCATAQIRFPPGVRREETGKAVMAQDKPRDFPVRCDEPVEGEDLTWVLYGSGGCSLYDTAKLRALGCVDESYEPAYVEDLDLGYRAWQRGWPTVYTAGAVVEHRHRATTSRYYTEQHLEAVLEVNYLKFLARAVYDHSVFRRLWRQALDRLRLLSARPAAREALRKAAAIARGGGPALKPVRAEEDFLALTNGSVAVFPGRADGGGACVVSVSRLEPPRPEWLAAYRDVIEVRGPASSRSFRAACAEAERRWGVRPAQLIQNPGAKAHPGNPVS